MSDETTPPELVIPTVRVEAQGESWYELNFNVGRDAHPIFKVMPSWRYQEDESGRRYVLARKFAGGDWVRVRIWLNVYTMCNLKVCPPWGRPREISHVHSMTAWDDVKTLEPIALEIEFKRHKSAGFIVKDSAYEFFSCEFDPDRAAHPDSSPIFFFMRMLFNGVTFARSCVLQEDARSREEHVACLQWGLDRILEHWAWLDVPKIYQKEGEVLKYDLDTWPEFRGMFSKTLKEWEDTGNAWPLGDPAASQATKCLQLVRASEQKARDKKKSKRGLLL